MELRAEHLEAHLAQTLAPLYVVSGDEALGVEEALDRIRAAARERGYSERVRLEAGAGFGWSAVAAEAASPSLFAARRLIELRIPGGRVGEAGAKALVAYAETYAGRTAGDTVLLVAAGLVEPGVRRHAWYRTLAQAGVAIHVWPVPAARLPGWLRARAQGKGVRLEPAAAALLAERVEGNLLAAAQEVDKLALVADGGRVGVEAIVEAVAASARYTPFDLADSALEGNAARAARIVGGLREEGVDPVLVAWALVREVRALASMTRALGRGEALARVLARHGVRERRKGVVAGALERGGAARWRWTLAAGAHLDRVVKGAAPGSPWDALLAYALLVAGVKILPASAYTFSRGHGRVA